MSCDVGEATKSLENELYGDRGASVHEKMLFQHYTYSLLDGSANDQIDSTWLGAGIVN